MLTLRHAFEAGREALAGRHGPGASLTNALLLLSVQRGEGTFSSPDRIVLQGALDSVRCYESASGTYESASGTASAFVTPNTISKAP
jgi:hypothetical protein